MRLAIALSLSLSSFAVFGVSFVSLSLLFLSLLIQNTMICVTRNFDRWPPHRQSPGFCALFSNVFFPNFLLDFLCKKYMNARDFVAFKALGN